MNEYSEWLQAQIVLLDYEVEHTKCQDMHTEAYRSLKARLQRYSDTWDTLIEFEALQAH